MSVTPEFMADLPAPVQLYPNVAENPQASEVPLGVEAPGYARNAKPGLDHAAGQRAWVRANESRAALTPPLIDRG